MNSFCAVINAWLNASQRTRVGVRVKRSAKGWCVKHLVVCNTWWCVTQLVVCNSLSGVEHTWWFATLGGV